jgi:periplasmic protein TonB
MDSQLRLLALPAKFLHARVATAALACTLTVALGACSSNDLPSANAALAATVPNVRTLSADRKEHSDEKQVERVALKMANAAYQANRIVAPEGDNALEHALRARQANPNSAGATELLTDIMPLVTTQVQAMISARQWVEADRVIALLQKAHPNSLTTLSLSRQLTSASRTVAVNAIASNSR